MPKNIILIDDHFIVRHGLKELIEKIGPYKISHQFNNGQEFISTIPHKPVPDLIILDLDMPVMNGRTVMEELKAKGIIIPVLILTVGTDEETIVRLFKLGIRGYMIKNCGASELKRALEEIFHTGYYHSDSFITSLEPVSNGGVKSKQENILEQISEREKRFMKLVCHEEEYSYEQIANIMNVEIRTIHWYRECLSNKFGVKSKTGLVVFVLRNKLYDSL